MVPKSIKVMAVGTKQLQHWLLGSSGAAGAKLRLTKRCTSDKGLMAYMWWCFGLTVSEHVRICIDIYVEIYAYIHMYSVYIHIYIYRSANMHLCVYLDYAKYEP